MVHQCSQEDRIKTIEKILIIGNGQPSILKQMATLAESQENIKQTIQDINDNVKTLLTYKEQTEGAKSYKNNIVSKNQFLIGTVIAFAGVIIALLTFIFIR